LWCDDRAGPSAERLRSAATLLYKTRDAREIGDRLRWLVRFPKATGLGLLATVVLFLPQLIYWHAVIDRWLVFSLTARRMSTSSSARRCWCAVLFSQQNGWFIYTPLMLPVMVASGPLAWRKALGARTILLFWAIAWWLLCQLVVLVAGRCFGHRGFRG
jgi:hypothetical protein